MRTIEAGSLPLTYRQFVRCHQQRLGGLLLTLTICAAGFGCSGDKSSSPTTTAPTAATSTRVISVSGNLDFGSVEVGSSVSATLTISNSGNSTLTISGMTATNGLAVVLTANSPASVPARGSVTATIRFSPTSATPYAGTLSVTADHTGGTNSIGVSGAGVSTTPTPTCSATLNPSTVTIGTSGSSAKATIQVIVAAGCAWTTTADSWLTLRPTSGTGSGSVEVEGINYGGSARTASLRVGNATATVTQSSGSGSGGSGGGNTGSGPTCPKPASAPVGTTAVCNDGTYSQSQNRIGTCSSHGGVSCWVCPGTLCNGFSEQPLTVQSLRLQ